VGAAPSTPTAIASSGLTPAITLDAASTGCTLTSGVVSFTGVGTCVLDANQAGDAGMSVMQLEVGYARRSNWHLILALVAVDGLERVSGHDGRAAGELALQTLVRVMRSNLGEHDPVVRWGGNELLCGLVGWSEEEARRTFVIVDQMFREAVGVGVTVGLTRLVADETLDDLLARAQSALLRARQERRIGSGP
jgi:GGDEF domain-containing protein